MIISNFQKHRLSIISSIFVFILFASSTLADESWKLYDDSEVAIIQITVSPAALAWMYSNVNSDSMHIARVHFKNPWIDETIDSVGFRLRGNTSRNSNKKSFKLSFDTFVQGREFYGVDKMNLNGEHNDPSIIRSKLCWDFFQKIGMVSSRAAFAAVYINGRFYGLYISVEHIDNEFLKKNYDDPSGNLWKCLWPADLVYKSDDPSRYGRPVNGRKPYDLKTNEDQNDYTQLAKLIDVINNTPAQVFPDSLDEILSVPEVLKYFAMNVLVGGWDDYWFLKNNYYLYYEPMTELFHWIPYDYDNTFSIDWFGIDWATVDPYIFANNDGTPRPLATRIMATPVYRNLYSHFLEFFVENIFDLALWESRLDSLKSSINSFVYADSYRTQDYGFTYDDYNQSYSATGYFNKHVKRGIKEFAIARKNSILNQISYLEAQPSVYNIDWYPKNPSSTDSIYVTVSAFSHKGLKDVTLWFHPGYLTVIIEYPMIFSPVENTTQVEEADRWVGVLPPLGPGTFGRFQIVAKDNDDVTGVYPNSNGILIETPQVVTSGVLINEILAQNDSTNTDEAGEYDDWLELYNHTQEDILLTGMYLTDKIDNLTKWQFTTENLMINSGEYLLVWCDEDQNQGDLHTNFRLSANGEFVALVANDGVTIIDSSTFGVQSTDISYGRSPDGSDTWKFLTPTPNASNLTTDVQTHFRPSTYSLEVYPNPFNPTTTIVYQLPHRVKVTIQIYNSLGKRIWYKNEGLQNPGNYSVQWHAHTESGVRVSSGVYFCRIIAGEFQKSIKITLLE